MTTQELNVLIDELGFVDLGEAASYFEVESPPPAAKRERKVSSQRRRQLLSTSHADFETQKRVCCI